MVYKMDNKGLSLIEMIIILAIVMVMVVAGFFVIGPHLRKGRDARRKSDLEKIKVAMEEYYNDNDQYPDTSIFENCGSDDFAPYLSPIPCDPETGRPYVIQVGISSGKIFWYKLYTLLENENDPDSASLGLSGGTVVDNEPVNYGVSSPNVYPGTNQPAPIFTCPSGEEGTQVKSSCNANSLIDDGFFPCGVGSCGCAWDERLTAGPLGYYYCCPDPTCPQ